MTTYTIKQLCNDGPQFAMAMLLRCLSAGESFVTYGAIGNELEHQLKIARIFPPQIGHVAGSLMNRILEIDSDAPLINVMITRPDGIPGGGVGSYLAEKYKNKRFRNWNALKTSEKLKVVEQERAKIFQYPKWELVNNQLFGASAISKIRIPTRSEVDGRPEDGKNYGGPAESDEHKKLKLWVANNAVQIGIRKSFGIGKPELSLLSGDTIDVLFSYGNEYVAVEVKSCRSNDEDLKRGIYQCVKYRAVKEAEHAPNKVNVRAILVAERKLSPELMSRARLLKVGFKCVSVNKKK